MGHIRDHRFDLMGVSPDGPVDAGRLCVPSEVEVSDDTLYWTSRKPRWVEPRAGLLEEFLNLHQQADAAEVGIFARRWGVLGVCEHNVPWNHPGRSQDCFWIPGRTIGEFAEPISTWLRYSAAADAVVGIAQALADGELPERDAMWRPLLNPPRLPIAWEDGHLLFPRGTRAQPRKWKEIGARCLLAGELNNWLRISGVAPIITPTDSGLSLQLGAHSFTNLLAVVALRLSIACAGRTGLVKCSSAECTRWFTPQKRPNPGQSAYCKKCHGDGTRERDRKRKQRALKRTNLQ